MRQSKFFPLFSALTFCIAFPARKGFAGDGRKHRQMTLGQTETGTSSGQLAPVVRKTIRATRSDGSTVEAVVDAHGNFLSRTITKPALRKVVQVNEDVRATTTYYLSEARAESLQVYSGNAECTHIGPFWSKAGEEHLLGFRTYRFAVSSAPDSTVFKHWVAPDLDCASLRSSAQWTGGNRKGSSLKQVESVKLGELDSKLFEIPGRYREMSPSQVEQARALTVLHRELPPLVAEGLNSAGQTVPPKLEEQAVSRPRLRPRG